MTQEEYIRQINELTDILEGDYIDPFKRAELLTKLSALKYDYFMQQEQKQD